MIRTPIFIKRLFFNQIWSLTNSNNVVYLTFDDGPMPGITDWVLNLLEHENIKVTFFCIGDNIRKHPDTFKKIIHGGHSIGNHTFNHLNGWKTSTANYIENVYLFETEQAKLILPSSKLFRPPYGKITLSQSKKIRKLGYKIIMWTILSKDYDSKVSKVQCVENVLKNTKSGDIIVFHDSIKASENLKFALPIIIKELKNKGFRFDVLH
ncbi:MAG TPA: polysaccharide deacetylase family protein [Flavobacterium sp.]|nr:polysaccharide deacetylase family protein [Flavobacterium sp.]